MTTASIMVGVPGDKFGSPKIEKTTVTRYNTETGKAYEIETTIHVYHLGGKTVDRNTASKLITKAGLVETPETASFMSGFSSYSVIGLPFHESAEDRSVIGDPAEIEMLKAKVRTALAGIGEDSEIEVYLVIDSDD